MVSWLAASLSPPSAFVRRFPLVGLVPVELGVLARGSDGRILKLESWQQASGHPF